MEVDPFCKKIFCDTVGKNKEIIYKRKYPNTIAENKLYVKLV